MANVSTSKETGTPRPTGSGPVRATTNGSASGGGKGVSLRSLGEYLRGVRDELRKAHWPSRPELIRLTQVVLAVIFIVATYVGSLDAILSWVTVRLKLGI